VFDLTAVAGQQIPGQQIV